MKMQKVFEQGI